MIFSHPVTLFWFTTIAFKAVVVGLVIFQDKRRDFPWFTAFSVASLLKSLVLLYFSQPGHESGYSLAYWVTCHLQYLLMIGTAFEVFVRVFEPFSSLPRGSMQKVCIAATTIVSIAVSLWIFWPSSSHDALTRNTQTFSRTLSIVLCGAFSFMALFSRYFGIPWRHRVYGIGLGFLLYTSVDVISTTVISFTQSPAESSAIGEVRMVAYFVSLLIWAWYFVRRDTPRLTVSWSELAEMQAKLDTAATVLSRIAQARGIAWPDPARPEEHQDDPSRVRVNA